MEIKKCFFSNTQVFMFKSVYVSRDLLDNKAFYKEIFCESLVFGGG